MRGAAAAVAALLVAGAGQGLAQSLPPGVSAEEAHAGCIHTQLRACVISLGSVFWFDMTRVAAQIAKRNELDVNGRTAHRRLTIDMRLPQHADTIGVTLTLASPSPNDEVVAVEINPPEDPEDSHAVSDYDRTYLYDTVSAVLGRSCPGLDKLSFYRFYENAIKPHEQTRTDVYHGGNSLQTRQTTDTEKLPFCGVSFSLHRETAWYGPPEAPLRPLQPRHGVSALTIRIE